MEKGMVKTMTLETFFQENRKVALGFSGGVDSSYLLYAGKKYGADIRAYFIKTAFQPAFEYEDAKKMASALGAELITLRPDVLENPQIVQNLPSRCYDCKKMLFTALKKQAEADGYGTIIDGTNASDDVTDRPGMQAIAELSVKSPLREAGLTKQQIRELSKEAGLFTWDKPAYACLATRIPANQKIEKELLERIEKAENLLMEMGFSDFRVRVYHDAARIQWKKDQLLQAVEKREEIREKLCPYFQIILYDTWVR